MHSDVVPGRKLELVQPRQRRGAALTELLLSTAERMPRSREQVAAVCYRIRRSKIEFLLVQTRKGRWTFPKGGMVQGFTRAQSAALEAFEEAGVHGRIEEASFLRYGLVKRGGPESNLVVHAFLCEVSRLSAPQEPGRNPTWFTPEKAQLRLKEQRLKNNGAELARVIERAVSRIERVIADTQSGSEPMRSVQFEASRNTVQGLIARFAVLRGLGEKARDPAFTEFDDDPNQQGRRILQLDSDHAITFRSR